MKKVLCLLFALVASCNSGPSVPSGTYQSEASLPEGWPAPGPFNQVIEKRYPSYRAAVTGGKSETSAFFTLFQHINSQSIPMTAPVEMQMKISQDGIQQENMAFLYPSKKTGKAGIYNEVIEVRDLPATKALSFAWQGTNSTKNIKLAKDALTKQILLKGLKPSAYRLLGYNGPSTPKSQRTWEMQAILSK